MNVNFKHTIIVTAEKKATRARKGNAGDPANDIVMRVDSYFLIGTHIKQATGGIVRASPK